MLLDIIMFTRENKGEILVVKYFHCEKRVSLQYPERSLLHIGQAQRNSTTFPLEFCTIAIGDQIVMRKLDKQQIQLQVL